MLSPWLMVVMVAVMGCYIAVSLDRERGRECAYLGEKQIRWLEEFFFPLEVSLIVLSLILWLAIAEGLSVQLILLGTLFVQSIVFLWVLVTDFIGFLSTPFLHKRVFVYAKAKEINGRKSWWWVPAELQLTANCVGHGYVTKIQLSFKACEETTFNEFEARCRSQVWRLQKLVEERFSFRFDNKNYKINERKFVADLNSHLPRLIYEFVANEPGIEVALNQIRVNISNNTYWVNMIYLIA